MSCSAMALNSSMIAALASGGGPMSSPTGSLPANLGTSAAFATFGSGPAQPPVSVAGPRLNGIA